MSGIVKWLLAHALWIVLILGTIVLISGMVRALFPVRVVTVRRVTTVDTVLKNVPVPVPSIITRIVTKVVPPETVLVSQYHTDTLIREYCAAAADTNPKASRLFLTAGRYSGSALDLWGATMAEQAWHGAWGTRAPFDWTVSGDSVILRASRLPVLQLNLKQDAVSFILGVVTVLLVKR